MPNSTDTRDRVIAMEVKVTHLTEVLEAQAEKVDEMHALMLQAKGAAKLAGWMRTVVPAIVGFAAAQLGVHFPLR
jgi:hypothetical protein